LGAGQVKRVTGIASDFMGSIAQCFNAEGVMSWRLREPIPETVRDEVIESARLARASYMQEFLADAFKAAWRFFRRSRQRNAEPQYGFEASPTRRR
jgi:hypothetical protein